MRGSPRRRGCGCEMRGAGAAGRHTPHFLSVRRTAGKHEKSRFLVIFTTFSSDFQRWSQNGYLERCPMEARLRFPHRECTEYSTLCSESVGMASRTQDLRLRRRSRSFAQRSFARRSLLYSAAAHASLTLHSAAGERGVQRQARARRKFRQFWRVVIDFEHWRAASAALCAKRESEENFGL